MQRSPWRVVSERSCFVWVSFSRLVSSFSNFMLSSPSFAPVPLLLPFYRLSVHLPCTSIKLYGPFGLSLKAYFPTSHVFCVVSCTGFASTVLQGVEMCIQWWSIPHSPISHRHRNSSLPACLPACPHENHHDVSPFFPLMFILFLYKIKCIEI